MKLIELIIQTVKELGINHIFGVPGDYNLKMLDYIDGSSLEWVGCCNELNAGYCADGYARINGYGALLTTHGVGELSAVNAIAGSYAEDIPVIHFVGYPDLSKIQKNMLLHHTIYDKPWTAFQTAYSNITEYSIVLTEYNYMKELSHSITKLITTKKPVYIGVPTNILELETDDKNTKININKKSKSSYTDDEFSKIILDKINNAEKPLFIVGNKIKRFSLKNEMYSILKNTGIPYCTTLISKTIFDNSELNYIGTFVGSLSDENVKKIANDSDCIVNFASYPSDFNTGGFTVKNPGLDNIITIQPDHIRIGKEYYINFDIEKLFNYLISNLLKRTFIQKKISSKILQATNQSFTHNTFWEYVCSNLITSNDIVYAEAGTSLFGILSENIPNGAELITQLIWASIGYTLPSALGASFASNNKRTFLFIGDGSIQLTGQEISSISRYQRNIKIFIINNNGYTVERVFYEPNKKYHDIPIWDFEKFGNALGIKNSYKISKYSDFAKYMDIINSSETALFDCKFQTNDIPQFMKKILDTIPIVNN